MRDVILQTLTQYWNCIQLCFDNLCILGYIACVRWHVLNFKMRPAEQQMLAVLSPVFSVITEIPLQNKVQYWNCVRGAEKPSKPDQRRSPSIRASSAGEVDSVVSAMQLCVQSSSSRSNTFCVHVLSVHVLRTFSISTRVFFFHFLCVWMCVEFLFNFSLLALLPLVSEWYSKPFWCQCCFSICIRVYIFSPVCTLQPLTL